MSHPHLSELYRIYQSESHPFRKVHRMIDLFESLIKTHTIVIITEYVKYNNLSDAAKGMLAQGLRTPSLGTWQLFSRELAKELHQHHYTWTLPDFYEDFAILDKALNTAKTNVISFRNGYAHGATPSDEQCEADISQFEPFLLLLLQSKWLKQTSLMLRDNLVWIVSDTAELCLHPLLLFKDEGSAMSYVFFNDLKNDKVGLLNYPLSKHYREKQFFREFQEYLPLQKWKNTGNNEFYQRIEELTETFKGRTHERQQLLNFVSNNNKGYLSIQGNPGIGKSALIAQFFKDLKLHKEKQPLLVVEYFIRRGTAQAQVEYVLNYLLRRTDELFPAGKEIRAEGKEIWDLQQLLFSKWRLWGEKCEGSKLLFLIDGLDEGVENNLVTYLPRENFQGILIIYGSRPGGHKSIEDLWAQLPVEYHTKLELAGLGKDDIRALIYEVANKYEIDRESSWIDAVLQRSQGNPLYLKLLCDAMEYGSIQINDIRALPEKIDEYYKAILDRYSQDPDGDALLPALFTFAAAHDYLTMNHLGLINNLGEATLQRIGSTLKEVLYENPLTEDILDYQLFHESFREYLIKEKSTSVIIALERIIDFCEGWKELEGTWEQRYALDHYASHLSESKKSARNETLSKLIYDYSYTSTQKKVLKVFDATNKMYRIILKRSCELKKEEDILEAALCLVDLKYEEDNNASQIVSMVANGEIDLALKRIESFGNNDREGMKRKFILYMLCLMELTLLDSKNKPFRKYGIEKILNHLDEKMPVDDSVLSWNKFFSSYLIFLMACEWSELGLNYISVFKRSNSFEIDWISDQGPYLIKNFEILLECIRLNNDDNVKCKALCEISKELAKQGKFEKSLECANIITDDWYKSKALRTMSSELIKQRKFEEGTSIMEESIESENRITNNYNRSKSLSIISSELIVQGKFEEGISIMQESIGGAYNITSDFYRTLTLMNISTELAKQSEFRKITSVLLISLEYLKWIIDDFDKSQALIVIASELTKQRKFEEAAFIMQESVEYANRLPDYHKNGALSEISSELAKQGKFEKSLECANIITDDWYKSRALMTISNELTKKGEFENSLECSKIITDDYYRNRTLMTISTEYTKLGKFEEGTSIMDESIENAKRIINNYDRSKSLCIISSELAKQGNFEKGTSLMQESIECAKKIENNYSKIEILIEISIELAIQGKFKEGENIMQESFECANRITDDRSRFMALSDISKELVRQGNWEIVEKIGDEIHKIGHRYNYWRIISKSISEKFGLQDSLNKNILFQNKETRIFYLKGLAEIINVKDIENLYLVESMPFYLSDPKSIEKVLHSYALHEIFFKKPSKEKIIRLNKTLNIQWAFDIKDKFKEEYIIRLSSNLSEWISQIKDEDDRGQITLWAKQVAKGKMSESDFSEKIKSF